MLDTCPGPFYLPRAEEGRQRWKGIAARGEDEADGRKVVWFYALLSTLQLSSPLSSCDLVRTPWPERPPSQSLLTHPALRVPRSRPQPRPSPAPSARLRSSSLCCIPLIGSIRPHPPPLHREVGPEPRQPDFAPFSPGIAPTPSPATPNPPKVLSAGPSAASLLPIPRPGIPRSQKPGMHHLQTTAQRRRLQPASAPPRASAVGPAFPGPAHSRPQPIRSQWLGRWCRGWRASAGLYAVAGAARREPRIGWGEVRGR